MHTDKSECAFTITDLCSLKYVRDVASKEKRDAGTVDLPGFFLQTEADKYKEPYVIKLTGAVSLLLIETDESWRKYFYM